MYKQSSPCILHTKCSAEVLTADGADLLPSLHSFPPQGRVQGLGCLGASSETKTGTSHRTGQTDRLDRTCTLNRSLSGKAPKTRRRSPTKSAKYIGINYVFCITTHEYVNIQRHPLYLNIITCCLNFMIASVLTLPPGNVLFQIRAISLVCPEPELLR